MFGALPMKISVKQGDVLLGKYLIERVLGKGGMGVVVAARHIQLGELYAIKFLLPAASEHEQGLERFMREARASAKLKGEHIARVHDVGSLDDGTSYMIMEYLDGCDLRAIVRKQVPLSIPEVLLYALQTCDALAEAHAAGIIHRDIKSANLFLTTRPNGSPCVKVLDFGISKHIECDGVDLTQTGAILGSPLYMSPEQMARSRSVDARTDIWSLGIVIFELLTGKPPFAAKTVMEAVAKVMTEDPPSLRSIRPDLSEDLEMLVMKCLAKQREDRYPSVAELANDLRRVQESKGVIARRKHNDASDAARGVGQPTNREPQADKTLAMHSRDQSVPDLRTDGLRDLSLSITSAWSGTEKKSTVEPPPRNRTVFVALGLVAVTAVMGGAWYFVRNSSGSTTEPVVSAGASVEGLPTPLSASALSGAPMSSGPSMTPEQRLSASAAPPSLPLGKSANAPLLRPKATPPPTKKAKGTLYNNDD